MNIQQDTNYNQCLAFITANICTTERQNAKWNMVSMLLPKGKYHTKGTSKKVEAFWEKYQSVDTISNAIGLAEGNINMDAAMPVIVDIDIKCHVSTVKELTPLYSIDNVKKLIKIYQETIIEIVKDVKEYQLICIFLSKSPYIVEKNDKILKKHGFHLHFPYLNILKKDQINYLFPKIFDRIEESGLSQDNLDKNIYKAPWLLYGGRKEEHLQPYLLDTIFDHRLKTLTVEQLFKDRVFKNSSYENFIVANNFETQLPRLLSIDCANKDFNFINDEIRQEEDIKNSLKEIDLNKNFNNQCNMTHEILPQSQEIERLEKILSLLNSYRAEDRFEWLKVGWIINKVTQSFDEQIGLNLWKDFSQRCLDKYDESVCEREWQSMTIREDGYSIGSLFFMAKADSPELYHTLFQDNLETNLMVHAAFDCKDHSRLIKVLYLWLKEILCYSGITKEWYFFKDHGWEVSEDAGEFYALFDDVIVPNFQKIKVSLQNEDDDESKDKSKTISKFLSILGNHQYRNTIIDAAKNKFRNQRKVDQIDSDPYKIRFINGTYDTQSNLLYNGLPEDYMCRQLPIKLMNYNHNHPDIIEIINFLNKIFPIYNVRKYFLDFYCNIFVGKNSSKKVIFWTGTGDNGKSVLQHLFEKMLGPFLVKFETTLFTGKKAQSGAAVPELSRAKAPVRLAFLEEPDSSERINIGTFKKLSGGDKFIARDLYQSGKSMRENTVMFQCCFVCNKLPEINSPDRAFWNRVIIIPFVSTFIKSTDPALPDTVEEQNKQFKFPMDKHFDDKLSRLAPAFAWYLLEHRKNITGEIIEPPEVLAPTKQYENENDIYRNFIDDKIKIGTSADIVTIADLYIVFVQWLKEEGYTQQPPKKTEFKINFNKSIKLDISTTRWKGIIIVDDSNSEEAI